MLIFGSIIVIFEHLFFFACTHFCDQNPLIINYYATTKKNCIFPSLVCPDYRCMRNKTASLVRMYGVISTIADVFLPRV